MTAGSLLTILFYIWLAITAVGAIVWYRRRAKRLSRQADAKRSNVGNRNRGDRPGSETSASAGTAVAASGAELGIDTEDPTVDRPPNLNEFLTPEDSEYGADGHDFTGTDLYDQDSVDPELETVPGGFNADGDELLDDGLTVHDLPEDDLNNNYAAEAEFEAGFDHDSGVEIDVDHQADEYSTDDYATDEYTADNHMALGSLPHHEHQSTPNLGHLLSEFDLPYDLAPLGGDDAPDPNGHVTLVSEHADAAEVGTALADELVELGYEFEPVGHDRGLAKRGTDVIALRIIPHLASSDASDLYRSSGLADSSVVVEMWSGPSNPDGFEDF